MIRGILNNIIVKSSNVTLTGGGKPKSVPAINSLVVVSVAGKAGKVYRILVNGSLFQSQLPFLAESGEKFLAKVIKHKPFSLALDNLTTEEEMGPNAISVMLSKIGIEENEISRKILKSVINNKKPLVKSKLKRVIDYLVSQNGNYDEIQTALLLNIVWSLGEEISRDFISSFELIFDLSFEELSQAILTSLEKLNIIDAGNEIVKKLNSLLIYQVENTDVHSNILAVTDKSKMFVEISKMIDDYDIRGQLKSELNIMQTLMLKYILQKSIFNMFMTFPEFIIVNSGRILETIIVRYDKLKRSNGELLYKIASDFHATNLGDFNFLSYLSNMKLNGDLAMDYENLKQAESRLESFNFELSSLLKVDSTIRLSPIEKFKSIRRTHQNGINSVNAIA